MEIVRNANSWMPPQTYGIKNSQGNGLTDSENELKITGGGLGEKEGEEIVRKFGMDMYMLLNLKQITNKDLLFRAGNSTQC